ncbi:hypothetical protein M758_7G146700 [Ceratodon purpureus]|nr:hypothetical protein M758_7G146700 [Ceratodon purpureus]
MSNSLCLGQTVACISSSGAVASQNGSISKDVSRVSFGPVRVGRVPVVNIARQPKRTSVTRNELLGSKVGSRGAHVGCGLGLGRAVSNGSKWSAGTWLDNRASVDADISVADAWELWSDREKIPRWMKWIDNVTVSKQKPDFSKWTLRYRAFNRDFEFSWLARNMEPVHHQKIHWRSVDGLPNRGAVRFFPRGRNACRIELTISYELPDIMAPLGTAVGPIVEGVLKNDLNRFAKLSASKQLARV